MLPLAHGGLTQNEERVALAVLICLALCAFVLSACLLGGILYGARKLCGVRQSYGICLVWSALGLALGLAGWLVMECWLSGQWSR